MLGLFDSGLGGLTVVRRVRQLLPQHDVLFLADQAHVPYGDRTSGELARLLSNNVSWLDAQGVDAVVMACNTSCAVADVSGWPVVRANILNLIESAAIAVGDAGYRRIGVIATTATAATGAYGRTIRARVPGAHVVEIAAPALVPLVEAGKAVSGEAARAVAAACEGLPRDLDAVVLACTHFPLLDTYFADVLGEHVARIDPALEQAGRTAALAQARRLQPGSGRTRYVTTGDVNAFRTNIIDLTGEASPECERLDLGEYLNSR